MTAEGTIRDMPTIETARLTLRTMRLDDAEDMFAYASDPEVARYTTWEAHRTIEDSRAFLAHMVAQYDGEDPFSWAIVHRAERTMIGTVGLGEWSPRHRRAELMYALGRRYWGQGYTTEAARAVIAFGFSALDLNRIQARCTVENVASARVMEKAGMAFEGILREYTFVKGGFDTVKIYSILRREWAR